MIGHPRTQPFNTVGIAELFNDVVNILPPYIYNMPGLSRCLATHDYVDTRIHAKSCSTTDLSLKNTRSIIRYTMNEKSIDVTSYHC